MKTSEQITDLATALCVAQGKMKAAVKDAENPHFKSKYADLASVWDACRGPLTDVGLSVAQFPSADGARVTVTTMLMHKSGQWVSEDLSLTAQQNTPQGIGSAITYGRRYGLSAMVGIAQDDDDGEAAMGSRGSKEAARAVAERKISEMKAVPPPVPVPDAKADSPDFKAIMESFGLLKSRAVEMGQERVYYDVLGAHGFEHANQIRPISDARKIYKEIAKCLTDIKSQEALTV